MASARPHLSLIYLLPLWLLSTLAAAEERYREVEISAPFIDYRQARDAPFPLLLAAE